MTVYAYSRVPAFNPNTNPASVAKSASGSVYDLGDTGFLTPLNLTLVATNTVTTTLYSDANGMFPDFTLADRTQCVFKAGTQAFVLTTTTPIAGPTGAASTVPGPPGPATTDASLLAAGTVADARLPSRLSDSQLSATYVPRWKTATVYLAGDAVLNPSGDVVTAIANFTSGASYNATNWNISATYATPAAVTAAVASKADTTALTAHTGNVSNPHAVTKAQVGLGSVDNTTDTTKPVSTAQQTALDLKAPLASPAFTGTPTGITKTHIGLGNVDNTSDVNKPVSTAQATALAAKLDVATAATTYAPLIEFHSKNYASIPALFTAAAAYGDYCIICIAPGSYTSAPVRIDASHVTLDLRGAKVTLANGSNDDWLRVGANALSLHILGGVIDCNGTNQTGTSHGIRFEQYTGAFRIADRSNIVHTEVINSLTGGIRIEAKRIEIQMHHVAIRTFGTYGVYMGSTDCGFYDGAIGIGTNCIVIDSGANWVRNSGLYSATDYAIKMTLNATDTFITNNMIDNNVGGGITAVGAAGSTLNALISGNEFRGNSTGTTGTYPDIYLEQVRNINIVGNVSGLQPGSASQSKYAIQTGAGVGFINALANMFDPNYHLTDIYSDYNAIYARQRRSDYVAGTSTTPIVHSRVGAEANDRLEIRADGTYRMGPGSGALDTSFYRESAGLIRTDTSWKAPSFVLTTGGGAFASPSIYFEGKAGTTPTTGANTARLVHRDNGSGKGQLVCVFPTGAVQVIATEP